jgi:hypothetical protein
MTRVAAIEAEIEKLSRTEVEELRDWLLEKDWEQWDQQIEADAAAGKLQGLFDKAVSAHRAGESTEI